MSTIISTKNLIRAGAAATGAFLALQSPRHSVAYGTGGVLQACALAASILPKSVNPRQNGLTLGVVWAFSLIAIESPLALVGVAAAVGLAKTVWERCCVRRPQLEAPQEGELVPVNQDEEPLPVDQGGALVPVNHGGELVLVGQDEQEDENIRLPERPSHGLYRILGHVAEAIQPFPILALPAPAARRPRRSANLEIMQQADQILPPGSKRFSPMRRGRR